MFPQKKLMQALAVLPKYCTIFYYHTGKDQKWIFYSQPKPQNTQKHPTRKSLLSKCASICFKIARLTKYSKYVIKAWSEINCTLAYSKRSLRLFCLLSWWRKKHRKRTMGIELFSYKMECSERMKPQSKFVGGRCRALFKDYFAFIELQLVGSVNFCVFNSD